MKRDYLDLIKDFLALKRIAIIGVSRDAGSFSRVLMTELSERGYEVVPVNPHAHDLGGARCFPTVSDVEPVPDGALVMIESEKAVGAVQDCIDAGVTRVWMHRGCETEAAVTLARDNGMSTIPGECMFMYLPNTSLIHRIHGTIDRFTGRYPH